MRRFALGVMLLATTLMAHAVSPEVITFPQAVALALSNNPAAVASNFRMQAADGQVTSARGSGLPSLRVQFTAGRSNDPLAVLGYRLQQRGATFGNLGLSDYSGPDSAGTASAALNEPGYASNFNTATILTIPVYAGGADQARLLAAQAQRAAVTSSDAVIRAQMTFEVLRAYNGVAAAEGLLSAAQAAELAAKQNLSSAESLFKRGVVIESDVLMARAQVQQTRAAGQAAAAARDDALDAFRSVIGAKDGTALLPAESVTLSLPALSLVALQDLAVQTNPQLQALRAIVTAKAAQRHGAQGAYWPRVDLVARHDWNADTAELRAPSNTVMGVVSWELFSSGAQSGSVDAATAEWRAAQADLAAAENSMRLETARRYRAAQTAALQARAAGSAAAQAAEAARLLSLRYEQGLSPLSSLLDAQSRRDSARAQTVEAAYQAVLARAGLLLAVNRLDPGSAVVQPLVPAAPPNSSVDLDMPSGR